MTDSANHTQNVADTLFMGGDIITETLADLVILSENPLKVSPEDLDRIRPVETWREGKAARPAEMKASSANL